MLFAAVDTNLPKTMISAVEILETLDDQDDEDNPTVEMLERALEEGLPAPRCEAELLQTQEALVVVLSREVAAEGMRAQLPHRQCGTPRAPGVGRP